MMPDLYRTHTDREPLRITPEPWMEDALCTQVDDPDLFFPERTRNGAGAEKAKKVCGMCDVRTQCLAWALANGDEEGVLGGLTGNERKQIRRNNPVVKTVRREKVDAPVARKQWTPAEDAELLRLAGENVNQRVIGDRLGRSLGAVYTRLHELRRTA